MATCKVRIHLPLNSDLTPNVAHTGHFEIQIIGTLTLSVRNYGESDEVAPTTRIYTNPIVSYGDGALVSIYNNGQYTLGGNRMLCTISQDASIMGFLESWFNQVCQYQGVDTNNDHGTPDILKVVSGGFATYSYETHSCFAAVAEWLSALGNDTLLNIYNENTWPNGTDKAHNATGYKNYTAWPMFKRFYRSWNFEVLNT